MLTCNIDSFYFTPEELEQSPSRAHGISTEQENSLRVYGAQMVQEAGILLKCPQAVMATGQILLQRFYCKRSLRDFSVKKLAAAATFLACKLEECTRVRVREIVMVFDRLWKRRDNAPLTLIEPGTKDYQAVKDSIIRYEREMLRVFGFIVHCDHPHKLLISFVKVLDGDQDLIQEAWNIVNDSLRTPLCVLYKSEVVASGAIFYAARKLQICLPESVPWWAAFSVKTEQLVAVVRTLHELYQKPKAAYVNVSQEGLQPSRKAITDASPEAQAAPSQSGGQATASAGPPAAGFPSGAADQGPGTGGREENGAATSPSGAARAEKEEVGSGGATSSRGADAGAAGPSASGSRDGAEADRDRDRDRQDRDSSHGARSRSRDRGGASSGRERGSSGRDKDRSGGVRDRDRGRDRDRDRDRDSRDRSRGGRRSRSRSRERGGGRERERERGKERERTKEREAEKQRAREREKGERASSRRDRDKDKDRDRDRERERDSRSSRAERERERERERELRERSIRVAEALREKRERAADLRDESSRDGLPPGSYVSKPPLPRANPPGRDVGVPPCGDNRIHEDSMAGGGESRPQRTDSRVQRTESGRGYGRSSSSGSEASGSSGSQGGSSTSGSEGSSSNSQQPHRHHQQHHPHTHQRQHQQALSTRQKPAGMPDRQQPPASGKPNGSRSEGPLPHGVPGHALLDKGRGLREDDDLGSDRMYASEEMDVDDDLGEVQNGELH